eukprot:TRINITY_DN2019_c0_g1_i1.p1 TRINITY_DN2019_c0_g1~~TRINITY_DN2019_c0_g1_i1.p1  ORF type:complete len:1016 (-),score=221.95 TRINITY_DN2019_c0_g1_i1:250-3297(-)
MLKYPGILHLLCSLAIMLDRIKKFHEWCLQQGVVSPKVHPIHYEEPLPYGNGGLAKETMHEGETIITVPNTLFIDRNTVLQSPLFKDVDISSDGGNSSNNNKGDDGDNDDMWMVYLFLIYEKYINKENSTWGPWLAILPSTFTTPLYWNAAILASVQGTSLHNRVIRISNNLRRLHDHVKNVLSPKHPSIFRPDVFTYDAILWAYSVFWSRCISFDREGEVSGDGGVPLPRLLPLVDCLNYNPLAKTQYAYKDGSLHLITETKQDAGAQVFIDYKLASHNNENLLLRYGFMWPREDDADTIYRYRYSLTPPKPKMVRVGMAWQAVPNEDDSEVATLAEASLQDIQPPSGVRHDHDNVILDTRALASAAFFSTACLLSATKPKTATTTKDDNDLIRKEKEALMHAWKLRDEQIITRSGISHTLNCAVLISFMSADDLYHSSSPLMTPPPSSSLGLPPSLPPVFQDSTMYKDDKYSLTEAKAYVMLRTYLANVLASMKGSPHVIKSTPATARDLQAATSYWDAQAQIITLCVDHIDGWLWGLFHENGPVPAYPSSVIPSSPVMDAYAVWLQNGIPHQMYRSRDQLELSRLRVQRDITGGGEVFHVPLSCCITLEDVMTSSPIKDIMSSSGIGPVINRGGVSVDISESDVGFTLFLLREKNNKEGRWAPFFDALDQAGGALSFQHSCLLWSEETLDAQFGNMQINQDAKRYRALLKKIFDSVPLSDVFSSSSSSPLPSFSDFLWAFILYKSHVYYTPSTIKINKRNNNSNHHHHDVSNNNVDPVFVPIVWDIPFSAYSFSVTKYDSTSQKNSKNLQFITLSALDGGDTVLSNYGYASNRDLLLFHGLVPDYNTSDEYFILLPSSTSSPANTTTGDEVKDKLLDLLQLSSSLASSHRLRSFYVQWDGLPPPTMMHTLRIICLSHEEAIAYTEQVNRKLAEGCSRRSILSQSISSSNEQSAKDFFMQIIRDNIALIEASSSSSSSCVLGGGDVVSSTVVDDDMIGKKARMYRQSQIKLLG